MLIAYTLAFTICFGCTLSSYASTFAGMDILPGDYYIVKLALSFNSSISPPFIALWIPDFSLNDSVFLLSMISETLNDYLSLSLT